MKKTILLSLLFSFVFIGCSNKEPQIIFKEKLICIEQEKIQKNENIKIRVHNDDIAIAKAFKDSLMIAFDFYETQVDRNNKMCEEIDKK
uniref:hypothetical protein n=1 Tax=Aliarcobacter sp. TaxID=2321116 RepID=UPI0040489B34